MDCRIEIMRYRTPLWHRPSYPRSRVGIAAAAAAVVGISVAIPLLRILPLHAATDQLIGLASLNHITSSANIRILAALFFASAAFAIVGAKLSHVRLWALTAPQLPWCAAVAGLLVAVDGGYLFAVPIAIIAAFMVASRLSRTAPADRWYCLTLTSGHALIVWTLVVHHAERFLGSPGATLILLIAASLGVARLLSNGDLRRGCDRLSSVVVVLPLTFAAFRSPWVWTVILVMSYGVPLLVAVADPADVLRRTLRWIARYCFLPLTLAFFAGMPFWREPPSGDLFEDGHGLLPAAQYMQGSRPYLDIVPGHGLVTDGVFQLLALRGFGDSYAGLRAGEHALLVLFWPLVYFLGLAAIGRPSGAFGIALLYLSLFPQEGFLRLLFALVALSLVVVATLRSRARLWVVAGVVVGLSPLFAVEFGVYSAVAALAALLVGRGARRRHFIAFGLALALVYLGTGMALALSGVFMPFVDTTFRLMPQLLQAYASPMPKSLIASGASPFWESPLEATNIDHIYYLSLTGCLVVASVMITRARALGRSGRALAVLVAWYLASSLSVVERAHTNYSLFLVPVGVFLAWRWLRTRGLPAGITLALVLIAGLCAGPLAMLRNFAGRLGDPQIPAIYQIVKEPRRAGNVFFKEPDAEAIRLLQRIITTDLSSAETTWFDFANLPGLYYLFGRHCPIRYYEVPFYEARARQEEVVHALDTDLRVRAALVPAPNDAQHSIDGIPNATRAPLVYQYLTARFHRTVAAGGLELWVR